MYLSVAVLVAHLDDLLHFESAASSETRLCLRKCASAISSASLRKLDRPAIAIITVAHNDAERSGVPARHYDSGPLSALRD
jgi:hypothetical protein